MTLDASPVNPAIGQFITVIMTVSNIGQADSDFVVPRLDYLDANSVTPTASGIGSVSLLNGPSPLTHGTISAGNTETFTWTFSAEAGGDVTFDSGLYWEFTDPLTVPDPDIGIVIVSSNTISIVFGQPLTGTAKDHMNLSTNSFNPLLGQTVSVEFAVSTAATAQVIIFNIAGERIRTIDIGQVIPGILYTGSAVWDGTADDGMLVTTGMYYVKLKAGAYEAIKLVAVIKQ